MLKPKLAQDVWYSGLWEDPGTEWWGRTVYFKAPRGMFPVLCSLSRIDLRIALLSSPSPASVSKRFHEVRPVEINLAEALNTLLADLRNLEDIKEITYYG